MCFGGSSAPSLDVSVGEAHLFGIARGAAESAHLFSIARGAAIHLRPIHLLQPLTSRKRREEVEVEGRLRVE